MDRETFSALLSDQGQQLLAAVQGYQQAEELALATRLRRDHPAELVSAALHQARLRQRAVPKFGDDAWRMYFTAHGAEQATRAAVATHRAAHLRGLGMRHIADLCCGVGGDALACARAGITVLAVDHSPLTCAVAAANAEALGLADRIDVRCADVTDVDTSGYDAVFLDPARRGGRGRIFDPEAYAPPLSWAVAAARKAPRAALKVAPGIPHDAVPDDAAAQWVSHRGEVKEAVLWFGAPDAASPTATLLPEEHTLESRQLPDPPVAPVRRYLYEPDGAVIRAHLVAEFAATVHGTLIDPTIAYVSSDSRAETPFAAGFEITDVLPFNLKKLRALLRQRQVGRLTVKKRGSAVDPDELRRKLRPTGDNTAVVLLTRVGGAPSMLLGQALS